MVQSEEYDPYEVAKQLYPDLPQGFPYDNFDLEELILPPGDDMGIKSDDDDVRDEDVQTQSGFGSCIGEGGGDSGATQLSYLSGRLLTM